ncbi:MAG: DUF1904 family protein [Bacilli bacterium]
MPYINFINVDNDTVLNFRKEHLNDFSEITSASLENIHTIISSERFVGEDNTAYIRIEWMNRDKAVEESVVILLKKFLQNNGFDNVIVYFISINKDHYYVGND